MIDVTRFIAPSSEHLAWMDARRNAITATQVAGAATPAGFKEAVAYAQAPVEIEDNDYMRFGRDNEMWVALALKNDYGIMPNNWLIAADEERWQMATPDGLSLDHKMIAEIKTTGTDWGQLSKTPIRYRRQIQWQLHCTDAEICIFAWLLRKENKFGEFVPGWFAPKTLVVERDEKMINQLIDTAHRLRSELTKGKN
jgi:putative phage-type endonuclease